jgi:hypothetical protein
MGFSQFLLRGLVNAQNEWTLVCLAWNLKRMAALRPQQGNREGIVRFFTKISPIWQNQLHFHFVGRLCPTGC